VVAFHFHGGLFYFILSTYTYDNNGNLTKDSNKGIASITYNSLNLPSVVTFSNGSTVTYTYSADGRKLRTVHVAGGTTATTDYAGNVVYENGTQKRLLTEAGYVDLTDSKHYFYIKDHLGNIRVVADEDGSAKEQNEYYPFGLNYTATTYQPYKYNGKELDTRGGLNWYDYGARHYDAALGRFLTVDPMAEKMMLWSPYGYCLNNPMKYVDKDGEVPFIVPFLVKGLIGAAVDATTQFTISMASGKGWTEAFSDIDLTSVGASFVSSALPLPKVGKIAVEVVDVAIDFKANGKIENVFTGTKNISDAIVDVAASKVSDKIADGFTNGLSKAISDDLSAKSAATMTKETKEGLKQTQKFINGKGFQTTVSAVTEFEAGVTGELVKQQIDTSLLEDELKNNQ
jgi:RHS repeat-associated protein